MSATSDRLAFKAVALAWMALMLVGQNLIPVQCERVSCLDVDGKAVDWWLIYKFPKLKSVESKNGFGYAYADPERSLEVSEGTLLEPSALSATLGQFYADASVGYLMWNDTPYGVLPEKIKAHAKGVMIFDEKQGCLIRHSVPLFPVTRAQYHQQWSFSNQIYGQVFLCMSVSLGTLDQLAYQYTISTPYVYDSYIPPGIGSAYKNLLDLQNGVKRGKLHSSNIIGFTTLGSQVMLDFTKSKKCDCDLWEHVISAELKEGMNVLSWGRPLELSSCPPTDAYPVQNIMGIRWANGLSYRESHEHSKWGLTTSQKTLCIGDINRMTSQRKRGGGATCFSHESLCESFEKLISSVERCYHTCP